MPIHPRTPRKPRKPLPCPNRPASKPSIPTTKAPTSPPPSWYASASWNPTKCSAHAHALSAADKDVIRAIEQVVAEIESGDLEPKAARARLYALQTLLVAMRMHADTEPTPGPLQLEARAADPPPQPDALHHLMHLQHITAEDTDL